MQDLPFIFPYTRGLRIFLSFSRAFTRTLRRRYDIPNNSVNAIHAGTVAVDPERWKMTLDMLAGEIQKARVAKKEQ